MAYSINSKNIVTNYLIGVWAAAYVLCYPTMFWLLFTELDYLDYFRSLILLNDIYNYNYSIKDFKNLKIFRLITLYLTLKLFFIQHYI